MTQQSGSRVLISKMMSPCSILASSDCLIVLLYTKLSRFPVTYNELNPNEALPSISSTFHHHFTKFQRYTLICRNMVFFFFLSVCITASTSFFSLPSLQLPLILKVFFFSINKIANSHSL